MKKQKQPGNPQLRIPLRKEASDLRTRLRRDRSARQARRSTRTRTKDSQRLGLRRDAVERMTKIEAQILAGKFPKAVALARELEESVSTIKRDIAFMIERLGKPIGYDAQRWGCHILEFRCSIFD